MKNKIYEKYIHSEPLLDDVHLLGEKCNDKLRLNKIVPRDQIYT